MNTDDPKFTAHALGEFDNLTPVERAEIEALLQSDSAAASEAEQTRSLAARLRLDLQAEEAAALREEQCAEVMQAAEPVEAAGKVVRFPRRATVFTAIAACFVVSISVALLFPAMQAEKMAARKSLAAVSPPAPEGSFIAGAESVVVSTAPEAPVPAQEAPPQLQSPQLSSTATPDVNASKFQLAAAVPSAPPAVSLPALQPAKPVRQNDGSDDAKGLNHASIDAVAVSRPEGGMAPFPAPKPSKPSSTLAAITTPNTSTATFGASALPTTPMLPSERPASPIARTKAIIVDKSEFQTGVSEAISRASADAGKLTLSPASAAPKLPEELKADASRAKDLFATGDFASAGELYSKMDTRAPGNAYVLSNLGVVRFRQGKYKEAEKALEKAVTLAPGDAFSQTSLGIAYYSQGKYDDAMNALTKALALDPGNATAHNYLGISASQKGWQEAAEKELETATKLDPNAADPHLNLAVVLATENPPAKAKANWYYRRALSLGADRDDALEKLIDYREGANTEAFDAITDNAFLTARENPLSTFSIDVDTASYAIVRRFLSDNQRPPKGAVRIEELINYFTYDYPQPQGDAPFSATMEVATCPWTPEHRLVRIGLKGREIAKDKRPASNLVFLIDVSGSMQPANKLPLLKQSLHLLIDQLGGEDSVAMVVYAGSSGCVLEPTNDRARMHAALKKLEAGGSTNGASGLELAYRLAERHFIKGGTNRVILATDGDWNVGVTNQSDLLDMIARKAKSGVFLTVLGFGMGNLKDAMMVKLADRGNGNYAYIDTLLEAKKVLVEQLSGTLVTIAKDVKIQVEFNPAQVTAYRLIGYEKRLLAKEDFNDDKKDAGEIGAGHTVTALYEVVPAGKELPQLAKVDALKYQPSTTTALAEKPADPERKSGVVSETAAKELLTLKLRYKAPDGDTSKLLEFPLTDAHAAWENSSRDFRFAAAVASYGILLRDSAHMGQATWDSTLELAVEGKGDDASGYRAEFISLLEKAKGLAR